MQHPNLRLLSMHDSLTNHNDGPTELKPMGPDFSNPALNAFDLLKDNQNFTTSHTTRGDLRRQQRHSEQ